MYRVLDLFCGTGAISHGLTLADPNFITVGGIDINSAACDTAKANNPRGIYLKDSISRVQPDQFSQVIGTETVDVVVGGPPCQGFSSIRPNRGSLLDDERNELYRYFIDYVGFFRPKVFLMENVVGLISHSKGELLNEVLSGFRSIGYEVDWRVLNSANYGVPQKRERLFVLGRQKTLCSNQSLLFPEPTHWFNGKVIGTKHKSNYVVNKSAGLPAVSFDEATSDLPSITSGSSSDRYKSPPLNQYQELMRKTSNNLLSLHTAANHSEKMLDVIRHSGSSIASIPDGLITSGFSSCYSRLDGNEPSTTITVKFTSPASSKCIHPHDDRAITPREAARVQSFEDSYVFCGSKTDIATQLGNAVPPLFGVAFGKVISTYLSGLSK